MWDPDDIDGDTHANMIGTFKDLADEAKDLEAGEGDDQLCIIIKNPIQFILAVDYLCIGCSFPQAARVMQTTKERTRLAAIGSCTDKTICKYARYACAINLQKLFNLLMLAWTFVIAMDMSTHFSTSYLNICICFHQMHKGILNVHILAIPVFKWHTGKVIFKVCCKALDVLCPAWKDIIIGILTDGKRKMTGRSSGVATRFQCVAKPNFICIWCVAHQLGICLQNLYTHFGDDKFYQTLSGVIGYLHR